jgi:hypothetical protein
VRLWPCESATTPGRELTRPLFTLQDWTVGERHEVLGSALTIPLSSKPAEGDKLNITVSYATSPSSSALGWLSAEQTKGGAHPYLYSQSQAIHGRSLIPSQDTPGVKATYTASIRSTLPVLMSARRVSPAPSATHEVGKSVVYTYQQDVAIPSYLVAIASGNLAHRAFAEPEGKSWRTGTWTEPEALDAVHWEFSADTNKRVSTAALRAGPSSTDHELPASGSSRSPRTSPATATRSGAPTTSSSSRRASRALIIASSQNDLLSDLELNRFLRPQNRYGGMEVRLPAF